MIVRILGEGQYDVADDQVDQLNALDATLEQAVEAGDEDPFQTALSELLDHVRSAGSKLSDDSLQASDAALPDESSSLADVRELLTGSSEGLIPG